MLGTQLSASGISVIHSDGEVDIDFVTSTLTVAKTCPVKLLGKDTNLLILILWHYNPPLHHHVHLYSSSSKTAIYIKKSMQLLSNELTQSILAIHVFWGCDITSRLHSVGSVEDLFITIIRQKRHFAGWREKSTSSSRWQEGENS